MTTKVFCDKVRYRKKKSGFDRNLGKEKMMFTTIRSSYLYLESLKSAALYYKNEWSFGFVCSDKNKLERNTVVKDAGISE